VPSLCGRIQAHDLGADRFGQSFDAQLGGCAGAQRAGVGGGQGGFEFQPAQVDHLQHAGVDGNPLARLRQPLRDGPVDRRLEHGVGLCLAGQIGGG